MATPERIVYSRPEVVRKRDLIDRIGDWIWSDGMERAARAIIPVLAVAGIIYIVVRLIQSFMEGVF